MSDVVFESPGAWWLPSEDSRKIPGLLRVQADGRLRIELFDAIAETSANFSQPSRHRVLHGRLHMSPVSGGTEITHFDVFDVRRSLRSNGTTAETLVANRSYVGDAHLPGPEATFSRFRAEMVGLREWLPYTAVGRSTRDGVIRLDVERGSLLTATVDGGIGITIVKEPTISFSMEHTSIVQRAYVECLAADGRTSDEVIEKVFVPLKLLLALALGQATLIDNVDIVLGDAAGPWPDEVHDLEIWSRARGGAKPDEARLHPRAFLIPGPSTSEDLQNLLTRWWTLFQGARSAILRVFALWEAAPKFVEMRFGAAADALELLLTSLSSTLEREVDALPDSARSQLPPAAEFAERWARARAALRSGEDVHGLFPLCEVGDWLMRFVILRALGADLGPACRSTYFRHAASVLVASPT